MTVNYMKTERALVCLFCSQSTLLCCISGSKSGTGTVIIQVEDENDNIPKLPTDELLLCEKEGVLGSVVLVAVDKDASPFSAPFMFTLPTNNKGEWTVTKTNGR